MVQKLNLRQQRALVKLIPAGRMRAARTHCRSCSQKGTGIMSILKSVVKFLGPIGKDLGKTVLKEIVLPFVVKKVKSKAGLGLSVAGGRRKTVNTCSRYKGGALRLAGQGHW